MVVLYVISMLILCVFISLIVFKNIISPPVILSIEWLIIMIFYFSSPFYANGDNRIFYFIFPIGVVIFSTGFLLFNKIPITNKGIITKEIKNYLVNYRMFKIVIFLQIIILINQIIKASMILVSMFVENWFYTLKYAQSIGLYRVGGIFGYTQVFIIVSTFVLAGLYFTSKDTKLKKLFIIQFLIAIAFAALSLGRTYLFMLFIPIVFMYLILNAKSTVHTLKVLTNLVILLLGSFFVINIMKYFYSTVSLIDLFYLYLTGSIKSFVTFAENFKDFENGGLTFRVVFAVLKGVGYDVEIPSVLEEFTYIDKGVTTNVYTFYKWYFTDFGVLYSLLIQFILGMLYGWLYTTAYSKNSLFSLILLSLLYYPLVLQFFSDQYFSIASTWIQIIFWLLIFIKTGLFIQTSKERKNDFT